jgi:SNF2 family DNA or RNA helicase
VRKKRRSRHFDKLIGTRNAVLAVSLRAVTIRRRIFEDFNGEPITDVQKPIIHLRHKSLNSEQMEYQEAVKHVWDEDERNRRILHGVGEGKDTQLLSKILQARLACVHPLCATARVETSSNEAVADLLQLFDIAHQREDASEVDTNRAEARAKFRSAITHNWKTGRTQQCVDLVKERIGQGSILIFSDFVSVLDVIEAGLNESQIELMRFDGTMTRAERDGVVQRFQTSDKPLVLLITSTCGGQGLTLTKANTVITLGPVWNPYVAEQCIARANRIGQKSRVDVFHLICYNSIERRALVLQDMKIAKSNTLIEMETVSDEALEYMRSCDIDKYRQTVSKWSYPEIVTMRLL